MIAKLRQDSRLANLPISDELLVETLLELADFDTAQQLHKISARPRKSKKLFEGNRLNNEAKMIANDFAEVMLIHQIDLVFDASRKGVPVTALQEIAIDNNKARIEMMMDNHALDAQERLNLQNHQLIERLNVSINRLIDDYDAEAHPLKKKALKIRIDNLLEELDARARQAAVQAGHKPRLGRGEPNPESERDNRERAQTDLEPLPPKNDRIGF